MNNRATGRRRPGHTLLTGKLGDDIRQVNAHPGQGDTEKLAGVFLRPRRHSADGAIATPESNARDRIDEMRKIWQPRRGFAGHLPREMTQIDRKIGPHRDNAREDVARLEVMLDAVGKMDLNRTKGPTGYYGVLHNDAIRTFQKDRGLKVDGEVFPGGETLTALAQNLEDKGKVQISSAAPLRGKKSPPRTKTERPDPQVEQKNPSDPQKPTTNPCQGYIDELNHSIDRVMEANRAISAKTAEISRKKIMAYEIKKSINDQTKIKIPHAIDKIGKNPKNIRKFLLEGLSESIDSIIDSRHRMEKIKKMKEKIEETRSEISKLDSELEEIKAKKNSEIKFKKHISKRLDACKKQHGMNN